MGIWKYKERLSKDFLQSSEIRAMSNAQLSSYTGIDISVVRRYRKLAGEITPACKEQSLQRTAGKDVQSKPLLSWQWGILAGTLLGDASITRDKRGRLSLRISHCERQKEYVDLLYRLLGNLCIAPPYSWKDKKTSKGYYQIRMIYNHPDINKLYNLFYKNGRKSVTQEVLDILTVPGLVCWFYDDGGRSGQSFALYTCSFTLAEQHLLRKHLFRKFGLKTTPITVTNGKTTYWSLSFAKDTLPILKKYLEDFYLTCFDYKIGPSSIRSSETARKALWNTFPDTKIQSDLGSDVESTAEMSVPVEEQFSTSNNSTDGCPNQDTARLRRHGS